MVSDPELVQHLKEGDESSFERIFNLYFEKLCLFAESITRNHNAAEEIVENLFLHLWINCTINPIEKSIKSYLYQSTYNNCLKYVSRQKKGMIRISDKETGDEITDLQTPEYPVANLILKEIESTAEKIIESMPEQCRKIYLLNRDHDLKYDEIALKLNVTSGTVKTQMSRAYAKLRKGLSEFLYIFL
jgi:RNA polymerase sigma-70 factor (ECF subfamily)